MRHRRPQRNGGALAGADTISDTAGVRALGGLNGAHNRGIEPLLPNPTGGAADHWAGPMYKREDRGMVPCTASISATESANIVLRNAIGKIAANLRLLVEVSGDDTLFMSQSDVQAAFYRIAVPEGMEDLFVLPEVQTSCIPGLTAEERAMLGPTCSPCMATLPMGWSWAVYFCQAGVQSALKAVGAGRSDEI